MKVFFSSAKRMKIEMRDEEYKRIKSDYLRTLDDAEEKCSITSHMYELVNRYLSRLDQELEKFKNELEADNAGITEVLERRSHELDLQNSAAPVHSPFQSQHSNHVRKKYSLTSSGLFTRDPLSVPDASRSLSTSPMTANGNSAASLTPVSQNAQSNSAPLTLYNANNAIAAAASQAIAATQQMQSGRRTASLKASIDAITLGTGLGSSSFSGFPADGFSGTLGSFGLEATGTPSHRTANKRVRSASQFNDSSGTCRSG